MRTILAKHNLLLLLFSILISILLVSTSGYARTWYIKPDQTGDAPTIQAAIDSSTTGDTVLVAAGSYYPMEPILCSLKDSLYILGEEGAENTIIDAEGRFVPFGIDVGYIVLKGFTFQNNGDGAIAIGGLGEKHTIIEDNVIRNNQGAAIGISFSSNVTIRNNLIYSNGGGVSSIDMTSGITIENNTIINNTGYGILLDNYGTYNLYNNLIVDNYYGVHGYGGSNNLICNNAFGNTQDYVVLDNPIGSNGNISIDPQFCALDPVASGNFYLQSDSPCAPGNHPDSYPCGVIGKFSVGCGSESTEETSWGKIKDMYR